MRKENESYQKIGLIGNPNVGKSTVFNALTGLKQHTGNWPGKTVSNASGSYFYNHGEYVLYDLPGTYSLVSHSKEEECARDFVCFENHDGMIIVCDAVCLERNLNLVLQTLEITNNVVVVVNLMDEAKKKGIKIDLSKLSFELGVPVIGACARSGKGIAQIQEAIEKLANTNRHTIEIKYPDKVERAIQIVESVLVKKIDSYYNCRWFALKLLDSDEMLNNSIERYLEKDILGDPDVQCAIQNAQTFLLNQDITLKELKNIVVTTLVSKAESIANNVVTFPQEDYQKKDRKADRLVTSRIFGIPLMILLLMVVFWITIVAANYPSDLLFSLFGQLEHYLVSLLHSLQFPSWLLSLLIDGVYRVLTWVISVMLPPMAIFFPLFTLLEDLGYLPRVAFNLDGCFRKCNTCGKQALTMCMGFGCNAAGVVGCRIIDSPRERLIAILTNNFVPCNGRFPTIIAIITMFFVGFKNDIFSSFLNVIFLTSAILVGILMTFFVSYFLSKTILKGFPSSFTLELPPYRRPQVLKVIVRSIFDRTLKILGRAVVATIPAGIIIWLLANLKVDGVSILSYCTSFLNPFAQLIGLDGAILMGFILGFPANEIVIYLSNSSLVEFESLFALKEILIANGWTWLTAVCMILFSLMHWPCATTCLTIHKETGSWKWTGLAILLPVIIGIVVCFIITCFSRLFGLV